MNRDPIAERGGMNFYAALLNTPINLFDSDGLVPQDGSAIFTDPGWVNCAGGAFGDGTYMAPKEGRSWKDVAKESGYGDFKPVNSANECDDHCGPCQDAVVMYVPKYHNDKDPFNEPYDAAAPDGKGYKSKDGHWTYDVHFAKRPSYCGFEKPKFPWVHVPGAMERMPTIEPINYVRRIGNDRDIDTPDAYIKRYGVDSPPAMCMCKDK